MMIATSEALIIELKDVEVTARVLAPYSPNKVHAVRGVNAH